MSQQNNYELTTVPGEKITTGSVEAVLNEIRPVWKGRNLITRVIKLLPVDPSSACQRLFNASIHDLKEKIIIMGVDLAREVATSYKLPPVTREEDILDYNVSKSIDLAYRIGILTRAEWRRLHRCYEIRRDLEHEDNEYEAVIEDCFYIFKSTIDIVLSKDPIELLKVADARALVESASKVVPSSEFIEDYKSAPKIRQKEIMEMLVSFAFDDKKPDIIRENSVELLRQLNVYTMSTVTIEIAGLLESKLGRKGIDLITAKIANACGAMGYFKKVKLRDFYQELLNDIESSGNWDAQEKVCAKLEDVGGLKYCPTDLYLGFAISLSLFYIGERSFGQWRNYRNVFFSNGAAPIILRIFLGDKERLSNIIDEVGNDKYIKSKLNDKYLSRRFEDIRDITHK